MKPMRYFLLKLKTDKIQKRMTKRQICDIMEKRQWVCIDSLIYNQKNKIVGSVITKISNRNNISENEFKTLPLLEIMRKLGSLQSEKWETWRNLGIKGKNNL